MISLQPFYKLQKLRKLPPFLLLRSALFKVGVMKGTGLNYCPLWCHKGRYQWQHTQPGVRCVLGEHFIAHFVMKWLIHWSLMMRWKGRFKRGLWFSKQNICVDSGAEGMENRYGCLEGGWTLTFQESVTICVLFLAAQIVTRSLCWGGPPTPPWTVWSTTAFPACRTAGSTSHLGTPSPLCVTWWNTTQVCVPWKHFWNKHMKIKQC